MTVPSGRFVSLFCALLIQGAMNSLIVPVLPIFLVQAISAPLYAPIVLVTTSAAVGIVVNIAIGFLSDRWLSRRRIVAFAEIWLICGALAMAAVKSYAGAILISAVFMCLYLLPSSQLFALAGTVSAGSDRLSKIGLFRAGYIIGWMIGPAIGGLLMAADLPLRHVFLIQAAGYGILLALLPLLGEEPADGLAGKRSTQTPRAAIQGLSGLFPLTLPRSLVVVLVALCSMMMGDTLRITLLPLVLDVRLMAEPWQTGLAMSIVPIMEIPALLGLTVVARFYGEKTALIVGALAGAVFYFGIDLTVAVWPAYVFSALYALLPTAVFGVGMSLAQDMLPNRLGLVTSLLFATQQIAIVVGGGLSIAIINGFGLHGPFLVFGFLCLLALVLLMVIKVPANSGHPPTAVDRTGTCSSEIS